MLWLHCATPHNLTPNHTPHHPRVYPTTQGTIRVISETGDEMRNRLRMHPPNYTRLPPPNHPHNLTPNHTPHHPRVYPTTQGTIRVISETGDEMRNRLRMHPPNYTRLPPPITPGYQVPHSTLPGPPNPPPPILHYQVPPIHPPILHYHVPDPPPILHYQGSHQSHPHHPQGLPYHSPTILHRVLRNRS